MANKIEVHLPQESIVSFTFSEDDRARLATALQLSKDDAKRALREAAKDDRDYFVIEIEEIDALALQLDLVGGYYEMENR